MSFPCPHCADNGTQRISMLYSSSVRRGSGHESNTDLGRAHQPPRKRGYILRVLLAVFVLAPLVEGAGYAIFMGSHFGMTVGALASWLPLIFLVMRARNYNQKVWPGQMRQWKESFICKACGQVFLPNAVNRQLAS